MPENMYDVIIIGAGPGGATAGLVLARAGVKVLILEKGQHPRFHIGESILPRNYPLIQELGLEAQLKALPHMKKLGAEFAMGNDPNSSRFSFKMGLVDGSQTFNIEREVFDAMLAREAQLAGAELRENTAVKKIVKLADGNVTVQTENQTLSARYLLDASGSATVVARHVGTRRPIADTNLHKVAYFSHFENVWQLPGDEAGHPGIIMADEGWFWMIALSEKRTSVGFVARPDFIKKVGVPADRMLAWAVERCPVVRDRMKNAVGPKTNEVLADFSYTCKPYAGPGYFLIGDAGCFLDPIFSTGVTLAMMGGQKVAEMVLKIMRNELTPETARKQHGRFVKRSTGYFWSLIRSYYTHSFRELFLNGTGPLQVHSAVISILAGQVYPRPVWALQWRFQLFNFFIWLNQYVQLVPPRQRFSLVNEPPVSVAYLRGDSRMEKVAVAR